MGIGLLVSGKLGLKMFQLLLEHASISFVLTDKKSVDIIHLCETRKIKHYVGNPRNGRALSMLPGVSCEVLVSVNYLFLIEKDLIDLPEKLAVNFHGSLLPKYRGRTPHVWAIINNESETGITAHIIDEGCDTGAIIASQRIGISPSETGGELLDTFMREYPSFVLDVLRSIENNTYSAAKQDHSLSTYFGKRTPDDGRINWSWGKERIYNWVRRNRGRIPELLLF